LGVDRKPRSSLGTYVLVLGLILIVNSAYIAAFGDPSLFYVANALLHPFLGVLVAVLFAVFVRRFRSHFTGVAGIGAVAVLAIATAFGVYLTFAGMTRPHSAALYAHVSLTIAGLVFLAVWLRGRRIDDFRLTIDDCPPDETRNSKFETRPADAVSSRESPVSGSGESSIVPAGRDQSSIPAFRWALAMMIASAAFYAAASLYHRYFPDPQFIIRNPPTPPLAMDQEGGGRNSLAFPSSAVTADGKTIRPDFFMESETCKECHQDIYKQWQSSMHHMASFNNQWYRKSIEYMQDSIGVKPSLWCGGCHDHALVFSSMMQTHPIREIEHTPQGQVGLGCMSCHSIVHVGSTMGQGNFVMEYPALDSLARSKNPVMHQIGRFAIFLNPKPHREAFLKPFHRQPQQVAEFCSVCHKVHLDVPVNNYRWIRGFNDYDNWQASGVSGQGARSFYYPPKPQNCADCHMPLVPSKDFGNINGQVHSHRFAAANTAVPTSYADDEQMSDVEKFLQGALSVDIFALAEEPGGVAGAGETGVTRVGATRPSGEGPQLSSTFAQGEESATGLMGPMGTMAPGAGATLTRLMAPLGRAPAHLTRGQTVRVEVVIRTRKVGHFFPGGTVDAFDCWVELEARDSTGRVIFWSGEAADGGKGPVDAGAHFYRSLQLDAHGNVINKRNAWATRAVMYAHLIPPGAADTVHYRLTVPRDAGDEITLTAKLNYRKFSWWNTQFAFAGARDPGQARPDVTKDYDDGHWLFNGDLSDVSARDKRIPDVPTVVIGQSTVALPVTGSEEDSTDPASLVFEEAVKIDPADRERWNDYGIGLLLQGDLKGAERAFQNVVRCDPRYADGWTNIARALIQEGDIDAAKPMLEKALALNPRLASAHYFEGLALKADGDYPAAYDQFALAAAQYPNDRVVRNQMGRMLFLQRKYDLALAEYQHTLAVDPEDLECHYNLMLCYRGLGNNELAAREEKLYLRFKADEASRAITGPFKLAHPEDNNEAQPIHEHVSVALEEQSADSSRQ
jgi:tetratricopeptide (TPR) repeat protein